MNEIKDKDLDSFIFSSTYERYKRNILKDREDKTLGQWSFDEEKINNLKYAYVYLKDSGGLIVKKYTIEKLFKSGFDKDFNDPNKFVFIFSESIDFFAQYPETEIVQGRLYGNSVKLDNLTKLNESEVDARINKSRYINSSEGKKNKFENSITDIRSFREAIFNEKTDLLLQKVSKVKDFYSTSSVKDLIFHVQERCFTLPQISNILENLNLEFLSFYDSKVKNKYSILFSNDKKNTSLNNWNQFEINNPDTFLGMYKFWVRKKQKI